jgi:hypothetical protein
VDQEGAAHHFRLGALMSDDATCFIIMHVSCGGDSDTQHPFFLSNMAYFLSIIRSALVFCIYLSLQERECLTSAEFCRTTPHWHDCVKLLHKMSAVVGTKHKFFVFSPTPHAIELYRCKQLPFISTLWPPSVLSAVTLTLCIKCHASGKTEGEEL